MSFRKLSCLWDNVGTHCRWGEATDDNKYGACALHAVELGLDTSTFMYVILTGFRRQKRLREGVSILRDTYIAQLV